MGHLPHVSSLLKKIKIIDTYIYVVNVEKNSETPEVFLDPLPAMRRVIFYLAFVMTSFLFGCYFDLAGRTAGLR